MLVNVIESVPLSIAAPGVIVTVAVVEVSVTVSSTAQVTAGSDVEQPMLGSPGVPLPTTKFVPVTPIVKGPPAALRSPTAVTAVIVGPATIAIVPVYVSRPSVNETGTLAAAGVPAATLIGTVIVSVGPATAVTAVTVPNVTPAVVELPLQSAAVSVRCRLAQREDFNSLIRTSSDSTVGAGTDWVQGGRRNGAGRREREEWA